MTIPTISPNADTFGTFIGRTNQAIGVLNNLTDGVLYVNGSIVFTNSTFSFSATSLNVANNLVITNPSGNSLVLFSSNSVTNGTAYITGIGNALYVTNNAVIGANLTVKNINVSQNVTTQNVTSNIITANTLTTNNLTILTKINTPNVQTSNLYVSGNITTSNITSTSNITGNFTLTQNLQVNAGAKVFGGLNVTNGMSTDTIEISNTVYAKIIVTNNQITLTNTYNTINSSGEIQSTYQPFINQAVGQYRAVFGNYGVILRNDGINFYFLQTAFTATPYVDTFNSFRPFYWNLASGAVTIDASANGTTFGGTITVNGTSTFDGLVTFEAGINSSGEIISTANDSNQFRAVKGNYGAILRNDGTSMYLLQTANTTTPATDTWNSYRPFFWNLGTGAVTVDATGSGATFGGQVTVDQNLTVDGALQVNSTSQLLGNLYLGGSYGNNNAVFDGQCFNFYGVGTGGTYGSGYYIGSSGGGSYTGISESFSIKARYAIQSTSFYATSDIRVKFKLEEITDNEIDRYMDDMTVYTYEMNGKWSAGVIAQDLVEKGWEKFVTCIDREGIPELKRNGVTYEADKILNVNYLEHIPYLIKSNQMLRKRVAELEAKMDKIVNLRAFKDIF